MIKLNKTIILAFVIVVLLVILVNSYAGFLSRKRKYNVKTVQPKPHREVISLIVDNVMHKKDMFNTAKTNDKTFKHIFSSDAEREQLKQEAMTFYKTHYGLPGWYLKLFMRQVNANTHLSKYRVDYLQSDPKFEGIIKDGGYVVMILPGFPIFGKYGKGIVLKKPVVIPYGYYVFGENDEYKIKYITRRPWASIKTYDGDYTIIDYDLEITAAPKKELVGLKGRANGLYRVFELVNGKQHILIKNILDFH